LYEDAEAYPSTSWWWSYLASAYSSWSAWLATPFVGTGGARVQLKDCLRFVRARVTVDVL